MNIFLGKLMNGIQNILNKVDISIKKDELIEEKAEKNNNLESIIKNSLDIINQDIILNFNHNIYFYIYFLYLFLPVSVLLPF